jgi:hypothetical protein
MGVLVFDKAINFENEKAHAGGGLLVSRNPSGIVVCILTCIYIGFLMNIVKVAVL